MARSSLKPYAHFAMLLASLGGVARAAAPAEPLLDPTIGHLNAEMSVLDKFKSCLDHPVFKELGVQAQLKSTVASCAMSAPPTGVTGAFASDAKNAITTQLLSAKVDKPTEESKRELYDRLEAQSLKNIVGKYVALQRRFGDAAPASEIVRRLGLERYPGVALLVEDTVRRSDAHYPPVVFPPGVAPEAAIATHVNERLANVNLLLKKTRFKTSDRRFYGIGVAPEPAAERDANSPEFEAYAIAHADLFGGDDASFLVQKEFIEKVRARLPERDFAVPHVIFREMDPAQPFASTSDNLELSAPEHPPFSENEVKQGKRSLETDIEQEVKNLLAMRPFARDPISRPLSVPHRTEEFIKYEDRRIAETENQHLDRGLGVLIQNNFMAATQVALEDPESMSRICDATVKLGTDKLFDRTLFKDIRLGLEIYTATVGGVGTLAKFGEFVGLAKLAARISPAAGRVTGAMFSGEVATFAGGYALPGVMGVFAVKGKEYLDARAKSDRVLAAVSAGKSDARAGIERGDKLNTEADESLKGTATDVGKYALGKVAPEVVNKVIGLVSAPTVPIDVAEKVVQGAQGVSDTRQAVDQITSEKDRVVITDVAEITTEITGEKRQVSVVDPLKPGDGTQSTLVSSPIEDLTPDQKPDEILLDEVFTD
jgi:hypothetical protein